jgi:serine/threonine protein kinase
MGIGSEKAKSPFDVQLEALARTLDAQIDNESVLRDIHSAFSTLLARSGNAESDIRAVLLRQYSTGQLRQETYQLVQQILGRIVSENVETLPGHSSQVAQSADPYGDTDIIPGDSFSPVAAEESLQVGSVLRDRFLLQEKVSGGSMGDVYKALDRRLAETGSDNPYVAIKVLAPKLSRNGNALRALQQEAAKGRFLSHPNIVRFIDLDRDDDIFFIVMDWLDGRSLADILDNARNNAIDTATALDIVRQIGQALDYAHRCGVVHADVKPGNIIITASGQAMLFDFGVARIRQKQQGGTTSEFDPGVLATGTPVYSSMQVLTGDDPVPADDVFSLGCLLYRLLAGYRAFGPRNAAEAAAAGMEPQRLQGISQTQWSALKKSLAYSRVTRFPSVAEFLRALDGDSPIATDTQSLPQQGDPASSGLAKRFGIAAVIVALLGGAGWTLKQSGLLQEFTDRFVVAAPEIKPAGIVEQEPLASTSIPEEAPIRDDTVVDDTVFAEEQEVSAEPEPATSDEAEVSTQSAIETAAQSSIEKAAVTAVTVPEQPDYALLPPPDLLVTIGASGSQPFEGELSVTEDTAPAVVDFVLTSDVVTTLTLRLEEVSYSGNRSPWESGQYTLQDDGLVRFEAGQSRIRTTIALASDPLREPDRDVVLQLRDADHPDTAFANLRVNLLDDDQRRFEAGLMPNTIAFAVSQVSVRERDPAVQIDVLRFKPDDSELDVSYVVRDVTATEGQDYFTPDTGTVSFGPGQRTARIFVPLVQDTVVETDEAFMLELDPPQRSDDANIFLRIAVMIRDDDS